MSRITVSFILRLSCAAFLVLSGSALAQVPERPAVVSAASYEARAVAPNSIAALFGNALSVTAVSADTQPLPLRLGTVTVTIKDARNVEHAAGLFFVSLTQINFLVPAQAASGAATVTVDNGLRRIEGTATIAPVAPALFAANANGQGPALGVLLRVSASGNQQSEPLAEFNRACACFVARPISFEAVSGEQRFLVLFGTGWRNRADVRDLTLRIGGVPLPVSFAGAQGSFAGLDQLNLALLPIIGSNPLAGDGRLEIAVSAGGFGSSNVVEIERVVSNPLLGGVQITGFEPARALAGERLTIRGSGFGLGTVPTIGAAVAVRIGNLEALVLSSTETAITVKVPYGAGSDKVSVQVLLRGGVSANPLPVRTSLSGFVEDARRRPLAGVRVALAGSTNSARTNAEGLFVLPDVNPDPAAIVTIDGAALGLTAEFPRLRLTVPVLANRDNFIAHPIVLQQATGTPIKVRSPLTGVLAEAGGDTPAFALQPGALWPLLAEFGAAQQQQPAGSFSFTLPSNAFAYPICDDPAQGVNCLRPIEQLTLTQIENSRAPRPLPRGYFSAALAQLSPSLANIVPGGTLTFPNLDRWPADQPLKLFQLAQAMSFGQGGQPGEWIEIPSRVCALGRPCPGVRVSADGLRLESDAGVIRETGIYFAALERPTTTLTGRLAQPLEGGPVFVDGSGQPIQQQRPLARALVAARGQVTVTDGNGGFVLRHVPVLARGELTAVEFSFIRYDGSGNERVERLVRNNVTLFPNAVTDLETTEAKPVNENRPPLIFAGARFTAAEGQTSDYELLVTDADSASDPQETLRVNLSGPPFATLIARGAGRYTLRLTPGFADAGDHRVTISAVDRAGATATQLLALTITDVNQPPRALAQTVTLDEDTPKAIMLTGNDPDRDALRFTVVTPPRNGRLSGDAPDLRYTPNANYFGADSFTFKVSDGVIESEAAAVTLQINSVNDAPTLLAPGEQRVEAGKPLSFTLTADDADTTDRVRLTAQNLPTGATLTPLAVNSARAAARFDWTPTAAQTGLFIVSFQATDDGTPALTTTRTVALTVAAAGDTSAGLWTATGGPTGGTDLSALLATDGVVLAGTTQFGVYRSANNGQAWTRNAAAPLVPNYITAFAASGASFFAASSLGGVYRSTDRGQSWQPANSGLPESIALLRPTPYLLAARGTTVFAVLENSQLGAPQPAVEVYRSTDDGATWARVETVLPRFGRIVDFAFTNASVFAAYQGAIYRSADSGTTWQDVTPAIIDAAPLRDLLGKGNDLFVATPQSLLRSSDQGATWTRLANAPPAISELALSGANLFAIAPRGTQQSVYRSTDNGAAWTRADAGLPPTGDFAPGGVFHLSANTTHVFVNAFGTLYVSANQGERWEPAAPLTNLTVRTLATLNAGTAEARLFAGTETNAFATSAPWRDWRAANNGLPPFGSGIGAGFLGQLVTFENLLFAQVTSGVFRTADGGRSWQEASNGLPAGGTGYLQTAGAHRTALFAGVTTLGELGALRIGYTVYRSLDRGASWQEAKQGLPNAAVICFAATGIEGDVILAGTSGSGVYLSADNGTTWRALNQGLPQNSVVLALVSLPGGSRLLAGTNNGLYVFNSTGQSWTRVETGLPPETTASALHVTGGLVFAVTAARLTACPNGGFLLPDSDGRLRCFGGLFDGQKPPSGRNVALAPTQLGLPLDDLSGEVFISADQGATWAALGNGLPRGVATALGASGRTVFAGTTGGGVFVRQF